jgi:acetyl esterase/lipase
MPSGRTWWAVAAAAVAVLLSGCGSAITIRTTTAPQTTTTTGGGLPPPVYGAPTNGRKPKALVMLIHGGGWTGINPAAFQSEVAIAPIFNALGFETMAIEYRKGALGVHDVQAAYVAARKRFGRKLPICAVGPSAGGHLALMLAVREPSLACVISEAGPSDLPALNSQQGGDGAYKLATAAFGNDSSVLAANSPALHASAIKAKIMLVYASNDPVVPVAQGEEMKHADRSAQLIVLPPGTATFVHTGVGASLADSGVSKAAKQAASAAEVRFLESVGTG